MVKFLKRLLLCTRGSSNIVEQKIMPHNMASLFYLNVTFENFTTNVIQKVKMEIVDDFAILDLKYLKGPVQPFVTEIT